MNASTKRLSILFVIHFVTFEFILRLSVNGKESTEERWLIAQLFLLIVGIGWSLRPVFSAVSSPLRRFSSTAISLILLFVVIHTATYYYAWHIRPNLGIYEEPAWVSKHPQLQRTLQARIERNLWTASE